jgi:isopentenyl diphosphate isomerase/L-lactate dehydrogenase-like FMN-dependent dehydrogenase
MNISEYHQLAKEKLSEPAYGYFSAGSDDMITRDDNETSFKKIKLLPRVLVDTSNCDTKVSLLGGRIKMDCPILVAPSAMHKLAHPDGEIATATAARELGIPFISSELATTSLEDIAEVGGNLMM